ncbi:NEQ482 [Nanoarchaeum equitans Kin4-M]|uniref:Transcription factor E n=1 Tax=Nanoarchaeum equitans (strain Kin4-M) TaxID=228908 RepID=TFE_NANEQ|nr:RecName: Full=Transcription factor E; Short=TFE; AltName: Full=TFIIE subunit alpha homolog; AltName: Full=Transcription initiation factor TFIIE [Nanoarchaeum equitans Kin4-M]AAR39325.1 NEQ482 [Nanoarchaeum equitans Kin4-M]
MPTSKQIINKKQDEVSDIYGKEMIRVIRSLLKHKIIDTESLSKKTGYSINTVRRALYTLQKMGIVRYINKEDKTLWQLLETDYEKILDTLLEPYKKEEKAETGELLFICPKCGRKYTLDEAEMYEFRCPEDGTLLVANQ